MKDIHITPGVSVIVATRNNAEHIEECLDSILGQSFYELEVIVTDVCSDDGTGEILVQYAYEDDRIRLMADGYGSIGHAKNAAIDKAAAPFVMIVEPEDCLKPGAVDLLYQRFQEDPELDLVKGLAEGFGDGGDTAVIKPGGSKKSVLGRWMIFQCAGMYRRSYLLNENIRHYDRPGFGRQNIMMDFLGFIYSKSLLLSEVVYSRRLDAGKTWIGDPGAVFDVCAEYRALEERLKIHPDKWSECRYGFWQSYIQSNLELYGMLARSLRPGLSSRMHDDIRSAVRMRDFDRGHFDESSRELLELLLISPKMFDEEWERRDRDMTTSRIKKLIRIGKEDTA